MRFATVAIIVGLTVSALLLPAGTARAAFTEIQISGEPALVDILADLYGLENLQRIDDTQAVVTDETWEFLGPDAATVKAKAKFASFAMRLGLLDGPANPNNLEVLLDENDLPGSYQGWFDPAPSASIAPTEIGSVVRFGLEPVGKNAVWSSLAADNELSLPECATYGADHMVTWQVVGNAGGFSDNVVGNYVIGWEDLSADGRWGQSDWDFNDAVFEVHGLAPFGSYVPAPASCALLGVGGVGLFIRRHRA
ncbi:MAG: DUF4114 domain-containing protein [Planctomycetes bacterium]|nr:DUF4114 domain-containing protein [Planctomycetota bacterium]